jgi:hypothetical protein
LVPLAFRRLVELEVQVLHHPFQARLLHMRGAVEALVMQALVQAVQEAAELEVLVQEQQQPQELPILEVVVAVNMQALVCQAAKAVQA